MKKLLSMVLMAAVSVSLVACGSDENKNTNETNKVEINVEALAESLATEITYTGEMELIPEDEIDWYLDVEEGVTGVMYMVSGVSCEEVAVFEAPDEATATAMVENIEEQLADLEDQSAPYDPKVSKRMEDAVLEQSGCYVILCVSDDSETAKEIVNEALGK